MRRLRGVAVRSLPQCLRSTALQKVGCPEPANGQYYCSRQRLRGFSKSGLHVRLVEIDSMVAGPSEYPPQEWQRYGTAVLNCVLSFRAARMSGNRRRFRPAERPQLADIGKSPDSGHSSIRPTTLIRERREDCLRTRAFELHRIKRFPA
jgi:hypothetical protein